MMRNRPLAVRLAVLMAGIVVVVLLVAGVIVNRAASRSLEEELGPRERQRLALAAAIVEEAFDRGNQAAVPFLLQRIANETRGEVRLVGPGFEARRSAGPPVAGETETISAPLSGSYGDWTLQLEVPSTAGPLLRAFNSALLVAGGVAVASLLVGAALVSSRVTRPLRGVTQAAHRLGAGDLTVRAQGGPDAESAELASAFNGMAERLERSEALRRRAASDLAHDLATPATVLESQLQAMVDGVVPADADQLENARVAAASLSGLISQLGELTQAESAGLSRRPQRVDLVDLATEIVASLDSLLRERGVTATVSAEPAVSHVDRGQLVRAVRNVVTNAVQHAPSNTEVRVEVTAEPEPIIRVRDHGPGISAEDLPYVFERFYRADRSRGTAPGSGIGLTVARELIVGNGGRIMVESTGAGGTTFRIELPAG
ncbi:MAG TPA: HAMP domain-containing sensor histidine kinase [Candidatus Limnocylindria bacterium]|nr:HAMP domain-containing sensor histidine kinase [Candidatus Limnocylindria bacterium]